MTRIANVPQACRRGKLNPADLVEQVVDALRPAPAGNSALMAAHLAELRAAVLAIW
jgi:hypothetical protein